MELKLSLQLLQVCFSLSRLVLEDDFLQESGPPDALMPSAPGIDSTELVLTIEESGRCSSS